MRLWCIAVTFIVMLMVGCKAQHHSFWSIENVNGVWWFRSPDGQHEFMTNVQTVVPEQLSRTGNVYRSPHFDGTDRDTWAKQTASDIQGAGFKAAGAWCDPSIRPYISYAKDLNLLACAPFVGDDDWEQKVEPFIREQCEALKNDRNLIGYYTDNELKWDILAPHAERYFEITSRLIRKYDPNHLILGTRFNHRPPLNVLRAMRGRVDAVSFNQYSDEGKFWKNMFREAYEIVGKPLIISEISFFARENRSGNVNKFLPSEIQPFGGARETQQQRADAYRSTVGGAAGCSFIIGVDWFQLTDEPPEGRGDGESYNFGVLDIWGHPYREMFDAIKETSGNVNDIHRHADAKQDGYLWVNDPVRPH